jgi:hypothetical protein
MADEEFRERLTNVDELTYRILEILPHNDGAVSIVALVGVVAKILVAWTPHREYDQEGIDKFAAQLTELVEIMRTERVLN